MLTPSFESRLKHLKWNLQKSKKTKISFKDFINESFDSYYRINDVRVINNVYFYYFSIRDLKYRIFVEPYENNPKEIHIGFELFNNRQNEYQIEGLIDELSAKEVLSLFGTILRILKDIKPTLVYVESNEPKKHRLYVNLMRRLMRELGLDTQFHDEHSVVIRKGSSKVNTRGEISVSRIKSEFKYRPR